MIHGARGLGQLAAAIVDIAVPPQCLLCDTLVSSPGGCCTNCWKRLRFIEKPYCPVSGRPFSHDPGEGIVSAEVIAHPPPYDRARSALIYDAASRALVTRLKFSDRLDLAPWMARWMLRAGRELLEPGVIVVPVPLHRLRRLSRRYNQSAELARQIATKARTSYRPDLLERIRATRHQIGLAEKARQRNVAGAFRVPVQGIAEVGGQHILLVDDVYTSGATVKAACRALKRAGAARVDVLTFARVEQGGDQVLYTE